MKNGPYFCLFLSAILLLVRYKTSEHERAQDKLPGAIKINLGNPSFSVRTQFITKLKCMEPKQSACKAKLILLYLCTLLKAESYAPEPNPGLRPVKFPCVVCQKAVRWNTSGVCCDSYYRWYDQRCMGKPDPGPDPLYTG